VITLIERAECMELLGAVKAGDKDALGSVFQQYSGMVYRVAYRITESAADAADVTQDLFLGLPEALRGLKATDRRGFEAWLRKVSVRTALQVLRKRNRRNEVSLTGLFPGALSPTADMIFDRLDLDRALVGLSANQRTVLILKDVEGLSHEEIASILGISVGASQVRLHRAKRRLWRLLKRD